MRMLLLVLVVLVAACSSSQHRPKGIYGRVYTDAHGARYVRAHTQGGTFVWYVLIPNELGYMYAPSDFEPDGLTPTTFVVEETPAGAPSSSRTVYPVKDIEGAVVDKDTTAFSWTDDGEIASHR